ncbi:MmgE/PrpD family protein [Gemmatimonadota bacterium]
MNNRFSTQLEILSGWITSLQYEDIPERVVYYAKLQLLDCVAAICAGARSDVGVRLKRSLESTESGGPCTLLPTGEKWSLDNTLFYHSAMINSLELDSFVFMGHMGQSAVSTSLALTEILDRDGRDLLLAMVAAIEVGARLSAYMASGPHQGHMRAFIHRIAGAAIVSKLHGADEMTTANAMAIALSMPEFPLFPASYSPDTKVICTGPPVVEGVKAGFMALGGLDAARDIVENPVGFFHFFSYDRNVPDIWGRIGQSWTVPTLSVKRFATCAYAQGPVSAALELHDSLNAAPDEIESVDIYGPIVTVILEKFSRPHHGASLTPVNTHFSTIRSVAATLLHGELTGEFYREGAFETKIGPIEALSERMRLLYSWPMSMNLLRGLDAGIENAGKPGILGSTSGQKTMKQFSRAFGSRPLLQWSDIPALARISAADRTYFVRRHLRSMMARFRQVDWTDSDRSHASAEGDLERIAFRFGGRVELFLKNGRRESAECDIPPGFTDDPDREEIVEQKFLRESAPVWGSERSRQVLRIIRQIEKHTTRELLNTLDKVNDDK